MIAKQWINNNIQRTAVADQKIAWNGKEKRRKMLRGSERRASSTGLCYQRIRLSVSMMPMGLTGKFFVINHGSKPPVIMSSLA